MSGDSEFQGVILAAGKGKRIQPFSHHTPKPLLPVLDRRCSSGRSLPCATSA
jgi:UTP-glucose-1-phosphate uridylyltransferase